MAAEDAEDKRSLEVLQAEGVDETCVTFVLHEQDHTLGNALRYMIMKNPEVVFCGYSITHPSEDKINLRIQTKGVPAIDSFRRGLCELTTVCEHVLATFETAQTLSTFEDSNDPKGLEDPKYPDDPKVPDDPKGLEDPEDPEDSKYPDDTKYADDPEDPKDPQKTPGPKRPR